MKQWPKMGNIEMIEKWKKLKQMIFFGCGYLLFLGDQNNFDCQINGEDQPCHWLDDCNINMII